MDAIISLKSTYTREKKETARQKITHQNEVFVLFSFFDFLVFCYCCFFEVFPFLFETASVGAVI